MTVGPFLENYVLVIRAYFSSDVTISGLSPSSRDTANTGCVIVDFRQVDRPPPPSCRHYGALQPTFTELD